MGGLPRIKNVGWRRPTPSGSRSGAVPVAGYWPVSRAHPRFRGFPLRLSARGRDRRSSQPGWRPGAPAASADQEEEDVGRGSTSSSLSPSPPDPSHRVDARSVVAPVGSGAASAMTSSTPSLNPPSVCPTSASLTSRRPASPPPAPPLHLPSEDPSAPSTSGTSAVSVKPLDARAHRGRLKKLSKLALRRARDGREHVSGIADRLLARPWRRCSTTRGCPPTSSPTSCVSWTRPPGCALSTPSSDLLRAATGPGPPCRRLVLGVLGRARQDGLAEEVFLQFAREGTTVQVFNAMMDMYGRSGRFDDVQQLLDAMHGQGIEPDLASFNALINNSAKVWVFTPRREVRQAWLRPDVITYNTLINACSQGSILDDAVAAEKMFMELLHEGFKPDTVTYNSHAFAKEGDVDAVERVCEEYVNAGLRNDGITYNTMIHMYGKMGKLDLALGKVLEEMVGAGLKPTLVTFSALICAYAKGGKRDERRSRHLIDGHMPDDTLYQVMLAALAKGNEHEEIERVVQDMVVVCQMDRQLVYSVLIKAGCIFHGAMLLKQHAYKDTSLTGTHVNNLEKKSGGKNSFYQMYIRMLAENMSDLHKQDKYPTRDPFLIIGRLPGSSQRRCSSDWRRRGCSMNGGGGGRSLQGPDPCVEGAGEADPEVCGEVGAHRSWATEGSGAMCPGWSLASADGGNAYVEHPHRLAGECTTWQEDCVGGQSAGRKENEQRVVLADLRPDLG
ncbi:hypothetical protein CFC21_098212 [Triticum aestivum]|uniref:Pentacotripeptide-repeat region of PRORP domain-containing protein n=1 Tax=Triticum aestivum TaxID=4565 RepID=A0A9R1LWD5_WHEAT|nr:hypothetical protein CFC21_098212 [Triticum aestivum]